MANKETQDQPGIDVLELGARAIKELRESSPSALDALDAYADAFELWKQSWSGPGATFSLSEREIGERIAEQHDIVMELTEGMQRSVEKSLRDLKGWSKGIRAYLDHFPKQVSTIKSRKG